MASKTLSVTWLGDEDPHMQIITEAGVEFIKGRPVDVPVDHEFNGFKWMPMFKGNPMFAVDGEDTTPVDAGEDDEVESLKKDLDELGVPYRANASLETLRGLYAKKLEQ